MGLCGEMAADPLATVMLVGMGVDELSTSAMAIPEIKKIVRSVSYQEAQEHARKVLELPTLDQVKTFLSEEYTKRFGATNKNQSR